MPHEQGEAVDVDAHESACGRSAAGPSGSVAIVTGRSMPKEPADRGLLEAALVRRGLRTATVPWDERLDWAGFGLVVIHTPWDYVQRREEFLAWACHVQSVTRLVNPHETIVWNSHKGYLRELARRGVPTLSTRVLRRQAPPAEIRGALDLDGTVVVKPAVSVGAVGALRAPARSAAVSEHVRRLLSTGDVLVQPFEPLVTEGELSLLYFGGRFSHAVLKTPAAGDYRVQDHHGGTVRPCPEVTSRQLEVAAAAIAAAPSPPVYARVDLIRPADPAVMELEVIEPELFLRHHAPAADRFAHVLDELLPQAGPR